MMRHKGVIVSVLTGIALFSVILYLSSRGEPRYQGKPLSFWIVQLEFGDYIDPKEKQEARTALRAMASKAVPQLIKVLEKKDSSLKEAINRLSNESPVGTYLFRPARFDKRWAVHVLGEIGPPASAAVPALIKASQDNDASIRTKAQAALIKIRRESVLPLAEALENTTSTNWRDAALIVGELAEGAIPAIPALLRNLEDKNYRVRFLAAMALGNAHVEPGRCIPALLLTLKDTNASVRAEALDSLLRFGSAGKEVSAAIIECLKDPDPQVRRNALLALDTDVPLENAKEAVPLVVKALRDQDPYAREFAAQALRRIAPEAATNAAVRSH